MGEEVNLLEAYPRPNRDVALRGAEKTAEDREIARKFGKEFFDGERRHGYGGFTYHPRFWREVIPAFVSRYNLSADSSVLDVGCAKGFMLFDLLQAVPGIYLRGIDISSYAVENSKPEVKDYVSVGNAVLLPYEDDSFDLVISINTVHNLEGEDLRSALSEIQRVAKLSAFITVDAFRSDQERAAMFAWNLTAKTILSVPEWEKLFAEVGYTGDYYWFIP